MRISLVFIAVAFLIGTLLPSSARAQDIEKQVARMNKKAMDDYDSLEFDSAKKTLTDAIAMLRANGVDETPIAAKTYINLGTVYIAGFKDVNRGKQQFVNALRIDPNIALDPALATPELEDAFEQARKQVGVHKPKAEPKPKPVPPPPPPKHEEPPPPEPKHEQPPPPPPKHEEPPPPEPKHEEPPPPPPVPEPPSADEVKGLQHDPVDEARPNQPIGVKALLGNDTGAARLFLFFRGSGQEDYVSLPMKHTKGAEYVATIPAEAVSGRALQYYLEARDQRGRPVVGSGSAPNPYIISITETAPPGLGVPEVAVEEDKELEARLKRQRREEEEKSGKFHRLFVFLMPGIGLGYEPGGNHTEVAWQLQNVNDPRTIHYAQQPVGAGGFALAPFHLTLEVGGMITQGFSLSLVGRFQLVTGANAETTCTTQADRTCVKTGNETSRTSKATGAVAGFLRARYRFMTGKFHPYVHLDIGYGQIRHMLDVSGAESDQYPLVDRYSAQQFNVGGDPMHPENSTRQEVCANRGDCRDTIAIGDVLIGGGAGIWYDFQKYMAFIFDVNVIGAIGVGDQSGMNIDLQLGIGVHFL